MRVGGTIVQYYVKVVPTTYSYLNGQTIETNQYSVTDHETTVEEKQGRVLPGTVAKMSYISLRVARSTFSKRAQGQLRSLNRRKNGATL